MPDYIFLAGVNGSGKSTFIKSILTQDEYIKYRYICADELEKDIPDNIVGEERLKRAKQIAINLKNICISNKENFIYESVCSHPSHLQDLKEIKDKGFSITLYYITTENPEINLKRIANRKRNNDYYLTENRVKGRYQRSMDLLADLIEIADTAYVYDSSRDDYLPVFYKQNSECFLVNKTNWSDDYIVNKFNERKIKITFLNLNQQNS